MRDSYERRMARMSRREGKSYDKHDTRLDKMREFRMAGEIFGNRSPYRSGMSMGFDFLHEDRFGPDNHFGTREAISSSSGPGDYIDVGID